MPIGYSPFCWPAISSLQAERSLPLNKMIASDGGSEIFLPGLPLGSGLHNSVKELSLFVVQNRKSGYE
jgi:hypothetical protein